MDSLLRRQSLQLWASVQEHLRHSVLFVSQDISNSIARFPGVAELLDLGVRAIHDLDCNPSQARLCTADGSQPRLCVVTDGLLSDVSEAILRIAQVYQPSALCVLCTLSEAAHASAPASPLGPDAYEEITVIWQQALLDRAESPPAIHVRHFPLAFTPVGGSGFVLQTSASMARTFSRELLAATTHDLQYIREVAAAVAAGRGDGDDDDDDAAGANDGGHTAGINLLAHALLALRAHLGLKLDFFALGPAAEVLLSAMHAVPAWQPLLGLGGHGTASMVVVDRAADLHAALQVPQSTLGRVRAAETDGVPIDGGRELREWWHGVCAADSDGAVRDVDARVSQEAAQLGGPDAAQKISHVLRQGADGGAAKLRAYDVLRCSAVQQAALAACNAAAELSAALTRVQAAPNDIIPVVRDIARFSSQTESRDALLAVTRALVLSFLAMRQSVSAVAAHMDPVEAFLGLQGAALEAALASACTKHGWTSVMGSVAIGEGWAEEVAVRGPLRCPSFGVDSEYASDDCSDAAAAGPIGESQAGWGGWGSDEGWASDGGNAAPAATTQDPASAAQQVDPWAAPVESATAAPAAAPAADAWGDWGEDDDGGWIEGAAPNAPQTQQQAPEVPETGSALGVLEAAPVIADVGAVGAAPPHAEAPAATPETESATAVELAPQASATMSDVTVAHSEASQSEPRRKKVVKKKVIRKVVKRVVKRPQDAAAGVAAPAAPAAGASVDSTAVAGAPVIDIATQQDTPPAQTAHSPCDAQEAPAAAAEQPLEDLQPAESSASAAAPPSKDAAATGDAHFAQSGEPGQDDAADPDPATLDVDAAACAQPTTTGEAVRRIEAAHVAHARLKSSVASAADLGIELLALEDSDALASAALDAATSDAHAADVLQAASATEVRDGPRAAEADAFDTRLVADNPLFDEAAQRASVAEYEAEEPERTPHFGDPLLSHPAAGSAEASVPDDSWAAINASIHDMVGTGQSAESGEGLQGIDRGQTAESALRNGPNVSAAAAAGDDASSAADAAVVDSAAAVAAVLPQAPVMTAVAVDADEWGGDWGRSDADRDGGNLPQAPVMTAVAVYADEWGGDWTSGEAGGDDDWQAASQVAATAELGQAAAAGPQDSSALERSEGADKGQDAAAASVEPVAYSSAPDCEDIQAPLFSEQRGDTGATVIDALGADVSALSAAVDAAPEGCREGGGSSLLQGEAVSASTAAAAAAAADEGSTNLSYVRGTAQSDEGSTEGKNADEVQNTPARVHDEAGAGVEPMSGGVDVPQTGSAARSVDADAAGRQASNSPDAAELMQAPDEWGTEWDAGDWEDAAPAPAPAPVPPEPAPEPEPAPAAVPARGDAADTGVAAARAEGLAVEAENTAAAADAWSGDWSDDDVWESAPEPSQEPKEASTSSVATPPTNALPPDVHSFVRRLINVAKRSAKGGGPGCAEIVQALARAAHDEQRRRGLPVMKHVGGGVRNLLSQGLGALGLGSAAPRVFDNSTVIIVVLGGITADEVAAVERNIGGSAFARALGAPETHVLVGGSSLVHVDDVVGCLVNSVT